MLEVPYQEVLAPTYIGGLRMPDQKTITEHIVRILRTENGVMYGKNNVKLLQKLRAMGAITKKDAVFYRKNPTPEDYSQLTTIEDAIENTVENGDILRFLPSDDSSQEVILTVRKLDEATFQYTDDTSPYDDEMSVMDQSMFRHTPTRHLRTAQQSLL